MFYFNDYIYVIIAIICWFMSFKILRAFGGFFYAAYLVFFANISEDNEKTIKIPKNYEWKTPEYPWIYQRIWIPEELHFIVKKTARIKYNKEEVNRKLNKILLQELTIDASLESVIELVNKKEQNDLIDTDS